MIIIERKPLNYWTDNSIITELTSIIKDSSKFPSNTYLRSIGKHALTSAISSHGGFKKFRKILGYNLYIKPVGYWTDTNIIDEIKKVITISNVFPTWKYLYSVKRGDLANAINENGGSNKFRKLMGYNLLVKPDGYWTDETILLEIKTIIEQTNVFPNISYIYSSRMDLYNQLRLHGGINKFRKLLGYDIIKERTKQGYWSEENIISELNNIIKQKGYFPSYYELTDINSSLLNAIQKNGGVVEYRKKLGHIILCYPKGYWTEEKRVNILRKIVSDLGHFPTVHELEKIDIKFSHNLAVNGGIYKYRSLLGYGTYKGVISSHMPSNYWTEENTIKELKATILEFGEFPQNSYLDKVGKSGLRAGIVKNGGINRFRSILGYPILIKSDGYWNDKTILTELEYIILDINRFPTTTDLYLMKKNGLRGSIIKHGGLNKYRDILGYSTEFSSYISDLMSYCSKRGKNTENLVYSILKKYCILHNLPLPIKNVKLSKGNIIEFICNTNKKIGIDVTNTQSYGCVYHKWTKKDYYKHLDELWVVVFSDVFSGKDYIKWNKESPDNVYVMSTEEFCDELQCDLDENTKNKISRYNECTFHTKEYLKNTQNIKQIDLTNY